MNADSIGAFGCDVPGTTPHLDRLAGQGMRFERAHVTIAVCQPCRNVLHSGLYPHRSLGEGFHNIRQADAPTLLETLTAAGYRCGILGKVGHSTPKPGLAWHMSHDAGELGAGRDPASYGRYAREFIDAAGEAGQPFFLMANSHDPHRPFAGSDQEKGRFKNPPTPPSRWFKPDDVRVPGFLPDLPAIRLEIAEYYSSVRRCDDTLGAVLAAVDAAGRAGDTLVIFLSDHGMALPFAKTNCYLHSTRTPCIVRWPGIVEPGRVEREHFISGIDIFPTIAQACGLPAPQGVDGFSFLPLLRGRKQEGRGMVFTQFHETSGRNRYPMRAVHDGRFGYIFNAWSDGRRVFRNESQSGRTMKAMREAAKEGSAIAARVDLFLHRTVEELYDFENDPDALRNLAGAPQYQAQADRLRAALEAWMVRTADPALEAFRHRDDPQALAAFMKDQAARSARLKPPPRRRRT
jgi:N-sulfoglucosamine sulfohydrolase